MSQHRAYHSFLVEIGRTVGSWQTEFKNLVLDAGWRVLNEDAVNNILDVYPGAAQDIGNEDWFEFLRVEFTDTATRFIPCLYATETAPEYGEKYNIQFSQNVNINRNLTINGEVVSVSSSEGLASYADVRDLFVERISQNSTLMDNVLVRVENSLPETSNEARLYLEGRPGIDLAVVTNNINNMRPYKVGERFDNGGVVESTLTNSGRSVQVDFSTGFIYYLSIFDRTITLSTKTIVGFYGPISGSYADNALAVANTPNNCAPVELLVSDLSSAYEYGSGNTTPVPYPTQPLGNTRVSHRNAVLAYNGSDTTQSPSWGSYSYPTYGDNILTGEIYSANHNINRDSADTDFVMVGALPGSTWYSGGSSNISNSNLDVVLSGVGAQIYGSNTADGRYRTSMFGGAWGIQPAVLSSASFGAMRGSAYIVMAMLYSNYPDVYIFGDNAIDESLNVTRDNNAVTALAVPIGVGTTEIELVDASQLPEAGTVFIGDELVTYSGKTDNVLNECLRGRLGTGSRAYSAGQRVLAGAWFVKINYGAILVGYERPT